MPSNSAALDVVYDCPDCGTRVEIKNVTRATVLNKIEDIGHKREHHLFITSCELYELQFTLLAVLDTIVTVPETFVIEEQTKKRELDA